MDSTNKSSYLWNKAAVHGLFLAGFTIGISFLSTLTPSIGGFLSSIVNFLLWAGKIIGCIMLLRYFLIAAQSIFKTSVTELKHYGMRICLFSSILVAAYTYIMYTTVDAAQMTEAVNTAMASYQSLDSNSVAALEKMLPKMPIYVCIFMLIYSFVWGWIASSILAKLIVPVDEFGDSIEAPKNEDENNSAE